MKLLEKINFFTSIISITSNFSSASTNRKSQNKRFLYGDRKAILITLREMLEASGMPSRETSNLIIYTMHLITFLSL